MYILKVVKTRQFVISDLCSSFMQLLFQKTNPLSYVVYLSFSKKNSFIYSFYLKQQLDYTNEFEAFFWSFSLRTNPEINRHLYVQNLNIMKIFFFSRQSRCFLQLHLLHCLCYLHSKLFPSRVLFKLQNHFSIPSTPS